MKSRVRRGVVLLAMASLATIAAGCGDDDGDDGAETAGAETSAEETSAEEVTLTADDRGGYTFDLSATPTAETKSVVFDNQGKEGHFLVFARLNEGFTVDEAVELEGGKGSAVTYAEGSAGPGKSKTLEVTKPLEPGSYVMLCPIPSPEGAHYELGQLEEFEIG
jgi:hypothetical protein